MLLLETVSVKGNGDRSVLVVGGSRGIGAAVVRAFLKGGDRVSATHRGSGVPDGARPVAMDVVDDESVDSAFAEVEGAHGAPEVVVCNAGVTHDRLLVRMAAAEYTDVVEINQIGVFRVVRRALPAMLKARRGSIVLVSSAAARAPFAGQANYAASKAALEGFARTAAIEYASRNIRVNVVAPGPTDTDMVASLPDKQRAHMVATVPLGRLADPDEVASAVRWVADATFVTGVTLPVTGGAALGY